MNNVIELIEVSYLYPDGSVGIKNVNLNVAKDEKVAILGSNGSGKSTLILLMSGLLKPTRGEVRIFGLSPEKKYIENIRRKMGVVFQNPDDFLFNSTVIEELTYVPKQLKWSKEEIERRVKEIAEIFGIDKILEKPPFRLSGGEKKKVEIASVLIYKPEVLLLDEPTANVDGKTKRKIIEILKNYQGTIVISTHEIQIAEMIAEKFVLINGEHEIEAIGGKEILQKYDLLDEIGII